METFHRAYGGDAFEGQGVGGLVGWDAVALGDGYDLRMEFSIRITRLVARRSL